MKVKEIMTKGVISLPPEMSVKEAMYILFERKISGLPVINAQGKLVGMFTEKDILRTSLPSYIEKVGSFVYEDSKSMRIKIAKFDKLKVEQIMRREVATVGEEVSIYEVVHIMLIQKMRRIPVVDRQGKVIGIIAREDIVKALAKMAGLYEKE